MQTEKDSQTYQDGRPILRELLEKLGQTSRCALFLVSGDGRYLPRTDIEESSGYVLDTSGAVHFIHSGWDAAAARPWLVAWERQEPLPTWERIAEYQQARERVGLA